MSSQTLEPSLNQIQRESSKNKFQLTPVGYSYAPLKIWLPIVLESLVGILIVCLPVWAGTIIDEMVAGRTASALWRIGGIAGLILVLSLNEMVGWRLTSSLMAELERDWKQHAFSLFARHEKAQDPGHIISIIIQDARQITNLWQNVPAVCGALAVAIMGTIQLWLISPSVAIVSLIGIILTILILALTSKTLEKKADIRRDKTSLSAAAATDIATAFGPSADWELKPL
ncbi:ABC transporter transmembrane domain-containing protein [uncultured Rothia sp.]|uniref:ABC transporter transmembrane domain-containing protein n=1 Tax=uncultured Rothia sp. TaxID=316088 RepID=UPI0032172DF9